MQKKKRWDKIITTRARDGGSRRDAAQKHRAKAAALLRSGDYEVLPLLSRMNPDGRMSDRTSDNKVFSDLLRPLQRWIVSKEGKHIDDVTSDLIRLVTNRKETTGKHVIDHFKWSYWHPHDIKMINGSPHICGYYADKWTPLYSDRRPEMYVCPDSGILRRAPQVPRKKKDVKLTKIVWNGNKYLLHNNEWFKEQFVGLKDQSTVVSGDIISVYDASTKQYSFLDDRVYKHERVPNFQLQQLSKKEKKALLKYIEKYHGNKSAL